MDPMTKPITAKDLHKFVWGCVMGMALLAITAPTALIRVSQMEKFKGSHVKSLTDTWEVPAQSTAVVKIKPAAAK